MSLWTRFQAYRKENQPTETQRRWLTGFIFALLFPLGVGLVLMIIEKRYAVSLHGYPVMAFGLVMCAFGTGFLLFVLREVERAGYGAIELVFGVAVICFTFFFQTRPSAPTFNAREIMFMTSQVGGCMYLIVRGLDNLNQGLKRYPKVYRRWQWICMMKVDPKPKPVRYPWHRN